MKKKLYGKFLKKGSIQSISFLYFLSVSVVIILVILCVELVVAGVFTDGQNKRMNNVFVDSRAFAERIKSEFEVFQSEYENNQGIGPKNLGDIRNSAEKLSQKYRCDVEFYIFNFEETEDNMDINEALQNYNPFNPYGQQGHYSSSKSLMYSAEGDIFVSHPKDDIASEIFNMYAYNYNLNTERRGVFVFTNSDFGTTGTVTRIYGASLAKIENPNTKSRRIALYLRVSIIEEEMGTTSMIVSSIFGALGALLMSFALSVYLSDKITHPIQEYVSAAQKLGQGDYRQKIEINEKAPLELRQLGIVFNQAAEEIEKTDSQRKEFLANVTHDLRTPLTMIRAYAEMIRDLSGNNPEKRNTHAQIIIDEADRLSLLVEDILNVSKLEAGTLKMEFVRTDMTTLCENALMLYNVKIEKDGYHIVSDLDKDAFAVADAQRITQVIHNLVQNAVNYTGEDKTVKVRLKKLENGVRIEVSDSGRGIAPEEIPNIWKRYYQINQKKRGKLGSGLGLDIVRGILTAHNARFGIDSELGHGTTFWFELDNNLPETKEE